MKRWTGRGKRADGCLKIAEGKQQKHYKERKEKWVLLRRYERK